MRLSEMTNEQAADTLVRLSVPLGNICDDEQITDMIKRYQGIENIPVINVIGKFLPEIATCALKKHRGDVMEIVGALTFQSREKAAKMNFMATLKIIREALDDEDLRDFFTSFRGRIKKTVPGSAQG